ncbi:MAG: hypothetical protein ACYDEH_03575 [Acidimicrobiales bacterium]
MRQFGAMLRQLGYGRPFVLALLPAATAKPLANNLRIPFDIEGAVDVGLNGAWHPCQRG